MAYKAEVKKMLDGLPTEGFGEVRLRDPKRTGGVTIRSYYDPKVGEDKLFLNSQGTEKVVRLTKKKTFNLSNVDERVEFYHIKGHPIFSNGGNSILECISLDEEAYAEVEDRDQFADAIAVIRSLAGEELRDFARVLLAGKRIPINGKTSDTIVKKYMYAEADLDPERVLIEWEDENKELKILLRKGLERGIFANA